MLALLEYRASLCACGCGHLARETTDERFEWRIPDPVRCFARTALTIAQKAERPNPEALLWRAERRR